MHLLMIDTCVWLELSCKKSELPLLAAIEYLVSRHIVRLLVPDLVEEEYLRNKDRVAHQTRQRLSQECKVVKEIVETFGGPNKQQAIDVINDVNHRLPILSDANYLTIERVEKLFDSSIRIPTTDTAKLKAANRAILKQAPFHKSKNSMADAILLEMFVEYQELNRNGFDSFRFVTLNHTDFSDNSDHRKPHADIASVFSEKNSKYFVSPVTALNDLANPDEVEFATGYGWEDETRGLLEILSAMDELTDKVWYNRNRNLAYQIETGEVEIVPDRTKRFGKEVVHESVWARARNAARVVEAKYDDTGPWTDFEWGMLNGKLSALRWVLGDEWDNLDT